MPAKCNPTAEAEAVFHAFPDHIDGEEVELLDGTFTHYLFYHNLPHGRRVFRCSKCGEMWEDKNRGGLRGESGTCPYCQTTGEYKSAGRLGGRYRNAQCPSLSEHHLAVFLRPGGDGSLLVSAGHSYIRYIMEYHDTVQFEGEDIDGLGWPEAEISFDETRRYYFAPGRVMSWKRGAFIQSFFGELYGIERSSGWTACKSAGEPFPVGSYTFPMPYEGHYDVFGWEALWERDWRYSQCEDYFGFPSALFEYGHRWRNVVSYLAWYCLRPQMEVLHKLGYDSLIEDLIQRGSVSSRPDWTKTNPAGFFRLSKAEWKAFHASGASPDCLSLWRMVKQHVSLEEFLSSGWRNISAEEMRCARETAKKLGLDIRHVLRRLEKAGNVRLWVDYIDMAQRLNLDLSREDVALPRNLQERHDACVDTLEYQTNVEGMKAYRRRRRKLEQRYCFDAAGYCIRVPRNSREIIDEGRALCHCVGGYAPRHISGDTTILFLRSAEEPDTPLCTIEMRADGESIRQIHGYRNDKGLPAPEELYRAFLEQWLPWLRAGSPRDRQGKPVLNQAEGNITKEAG
jgi:hypothetical protein